MIKTGQPGNQYLYGNDPNPETMKFVANKLLYPGKKHRTFLTRPVPNHLRWPRNCNRFPFIKSVFIASNFVLTKTSDTEEWLDVIPTIKNNS